jgi:alpha-N-arabinofuranosidase
MTQKATLDICLNRVVGSRDFKIFGHFLEHFHRQIYGGVYDPESPLADEDGFRTDVIEALRKIKSPVIRWPGGCFVSAYPWKKGVGKDRIAYYDKAWRVEEPNTFGTDEYVHFCRKVGSEPYICTNAGTGTPEEMSDWVEYCNLNMGEWALSRRENGHDEPYDVRYWSIGNENYGFWEIGAKTADEWCRFVKESAKMMKRVDPGIELSVATIADLEWNYKLLREAGDFLDWISIHGYWTTIHDPYKVCIARSGDPERLISRTEHVLGALGYLGKIRIAFDEWNLRRWWHPKFGEFGAVGYDELNRNDRNSNYTMADAIFSARFLNACLRHCRTVGMANFSPVVNTVGAIFTYIDGIVLRPTYHVFDLYANQTGPKVIDAHLETPSFNVRIDKNDENVPYLDAIATLNEESNQLSIVLINLHKEESLPCLIRLLNGQGSERAKVMTLTGKAADAFNDIDHPEDVSVQNNELHGVNGSRFDYACPAHSVTVLITEAQLLR